MSVQHTPGPWSFDGPAHNLIVWSDSENRVCFLAHSDGKNVQRDIANARLIAAAPDLLAALATVCAVLDENCGDDGEGPTYDHAAVGEDAARLHNKITTAIARATGAA